MKLIQPISTIIFLGLAAACHGLRRNSNIGIISPRTTSTSSKARASPASAALTTTNKSGASAVLELRGGYSIPAKTAAAASIAALNAVYGGSVMMAPAKTVQEAYNVVSVTPEDAFIVGHSGLSMFSGALFIITMLSGKTSAVKAGGLTVALPLLLRSLYSIIVKRKSEGMGYFSFSAYMDTVLFAFCTFASMSKESSLSSLSFKLLGGWHLVTSLLFFFPKGYTYVKQSDKPGFAALMARNYVVFVTNMQLSLIDSCIYS